MSKPVLPFVVLSGQGKEAVVGILEAGQFFGEGCLNGHALRIATTTALEECLITAIAKPAMIAVLHDEPRFSELFVAYLLTRNSRLEEDLIDCSIRAKNFSPGFYFCWQTSARKALRRRLAPTSVRRLWLK
jgi:CRP/FNR family cyclic AMP-dependent transcriptional regulator